MRQRLTTVGSSRAVILPQELLERYGFDHEIVIEAADGGLLLRPVQKELSFEQAANKLFAEQDALLERISNA